MTERFLTYGSACQDCGFNNQRIDLEEAARLARAVNRTLVVRNFACSPHSPCPWSNASSDGVIAALGGVTKWRSLCDVQPVLICDKDRKLESAGVRFIDARLFVDPAYFAQLSLPFMWNDAFHRKHAGGAASSWVMIQRRTSLSDAELKAPVWHASHLHKLSTLNILAPGVAPRHMWPERAVLQYAPWLHHTSQEIITAVQKRHGVRDFACAHCRLGDWGAHNGLEGKFQPEAYARKMATLLKPSQLPMSTSHSMAGVPGKSARSISLLSARLIPRLPWTLPPPPPAPRSQPVFYLATQRKDVATVVPALERYFEVETSQSVLAARRIAQAGVVPQPSEDIFSCVDQLVCIASTVFVGTPGSSVTAYVRLSRKSGKNRFGEDLSLSTTKFFTVKQNTQQK